ncbi:hypothetical protein UFOVP247_200 [uncultured Caudovirales phage]|uniref:Uncharacterized protein n=1 Tax=uncultured Caudovirales phage TaxID=2100421 RepID=A0A6J7WUY5_9CAUD|nr:hypothetical protein UFOVP247_200 [uncultured Caudovirales phage]
MAEDKNTEEDLEFHPWLINYRKKNEIEKLEILTETVKTIETNLGIVTLLALVNTIFIIALMIGALITGSIGLSSDLADAMIGLAKEKIGISEGH